MALAFQSGESVKQALFEELQNLLNADKEIRTNAEGRIKQLEFTEGKCSVFLIIETSMFGSKLIDCLL